MSSIHDTSHKNNTNEIFYSKENGLFIFSADKTELLLEKIIRKHNDLKESFYLSYKTNLIEKYNYSNKKSSKKAKKKTTSEAGYNFPFIYLEKELKDLLAHYKEMSSVEIRDKVATLAIVNETVNYIYQDNIYKNNIRTVKNLIKTYHSIPKNESWEQQASNLIYKNKFLKPEKIKELSENGFDLSTLNPPNSAFWRDSNIEEFDANSEVHYGEVIFPDKNSKFVYKRMGRGNIKIKANAFSGKVKEVCNTEEKSKGITIRLGQETNNHLISSNLARAIGYPYIPHAKRKSIIMHLCKTSFESFLSQWDEVHQDRQGSFLTYGKYLPSIHAVVLNDLALEGYPGKEDGRYRKGGRFRTESMGLGSRREIRGQLIFNAFIALIDAKEPNVRVDFYKGETTEWKPYIFASDLGRSLGFYLLRIHGTVNYFLKSFTSIGDDVIRVWWDHQGYDPMLYDGVTLSDARWMAKRLARLSDEQLNNIVENTHLVKPVKELYKVKLKERIKSLLVNLGISESTTVDYEILSDKELHLKFPKYINSKGDVKIEAENIPETNSRPMGANTTIKEALTINLMNAVFKTINGKITDVLSKEKTNLNSGIEIFGGEFDTGFGIRLVSNRKISLNPEKGKNEKRLLIKDTMEISIPMGLMDKETKDSIFEVTLPLGGYYTYKFDYFHSASTIEQASMKEFFKRLIPWRAESLITDLSAGEGISVKHSYGVSVGSLEVELNKKLGGSISPLNFKSTHLKSIYI